MDKKYIDDNHILDRYLLGQLSEDEACAFEAYYFEHPELVEELKIAEAMQATLREQSNRLTEADKVSWLDRLFPPKLGFAFSLILGVGLVGLLFQNYELRSGSGDVRPVSSLTLSTSRGNGTNLQSLRVTSDDSTALLRLELGQIGYPEVILKLSRESGDSVWEGRAAIDEQIGTIDLLVSSRLLTPALYALEAFPPQGGDIPLATYAFRVE